MEHTHECPAKEHTYHTCAEVRVAWEDWKTKYDSAFSSYKGQLEKVRLLELQYRALAGMVKQYHFWPSTGARFGGHEGCEICDHLEQTEKRKCECPHHEKSPALAGCRCCGQSVGQ